MGDTISKNMGRATDASVTIMQQASGWDKPLVKGKPPEEGKEGNLEKKVGEWYKIHFSLETIKDWRYNKWENI